MRISFTQYRNSVLATILDAAGSLICAMPVLLVVAALAELISGDSGPVDVDMVEIIAGIVTMGIFVLMGIGLKKLGKKVALNKQKKDMKKQMNAYYQNQQKYSDRNQTPDFNQVSQPGAARICPACGTALRQDSQYCPNCGTPYII